MIHSDDDGLILPPRLPPIHVVILPIYRDDAQRCAVLEYCTSLQRQLVNQHYHGAPLRVKLDDRDLRGGEKLWQHIKRGVPVRLEIGPRDVAADAVSMGRRDRPAREKVDTPRAALLAAAGNLLDDIQDGLFQRALRLRESATRTIDDLGEFEAFFTPRDREKPEIHGGLAWCHFCECPAMEAKLNDLKTTVRCVPLEGGDDEGTCIFCGRASRRDGVFAKAY